MKHLSQRALRMFSVLLFLSMLPSISGIILAASSDITRISTDSSGMEANGFSLFPSISADGRYVAFMSVATNLVSMDMNGAADIFVHDRKTGQTTRVSVNSSGIEGNSGSYSPSISADGRYVAFESDATNLVSGDTNGVRDIFVHDRNTGQTTRISVNSSGSEGNGSSRFPSISADGRYVAFHSSATNLVSGDTNDAWDVFVYDRYTGQTTRISVNSSGGEGNGDSYSPSISADGRFVAFVSDATNLVSGDTNGVADVFVHDRDTGQTTRISVNSSGVEGNDSSDLASISADGRYVAFESYATNLVNGDTNGAWDIFVHDRNTGQTTRISVNSSGTGGNGNSYAPSISADGRYVAFDSLATNLVSGDNNGFRDIFVHDRSTGQTIRVSIGSSGVEGNDHSHRPYISTKGCYVTFHSYATNLVNGDTNAVADIFVYATIPFPDVASHWARAYIRSLFCNGFTSGYPDGTYKPENRVTRAEMAIFLVKAIQGSSYNPPPATPTFSDTAGHWAKDWIEALKAAGITSGYPDGTYRPENRVTRAEMAIFLLKAINGSSYNPPPATPTFSDTAGHWAKDWIEALKVAGITSGYPDGTYRPENPVTRAEMAVFLTKAFNLP